MSFLQILRLILSIGFPPAIEKQEEFRVWCSDLSKTAADFALQTGTTVDDKIANTLVLICSNDEYWQIFYSILRVAIDQLDRDGDIVGSRATELASKVGIDPATIIAIVSAILEIIDLIKRWRD